MATPKTKLPPGEYDVLKALIDRGGDKSKVAVIDLDKKMVNALKARKGFLEADEVKQGRGTSVKSAKVLVSLADFERGANRAKRGTSEGATTRANTTALLRGFKPISKTRILEFIDATRPDAEREFQRQKSEGMSPKELARAIEAQSDSRAALAKMAELMQQPNLSFEEYLKGRGFEAELFQFIAWEDDHHGPDRTDDRRPRAAGGRGR